MSRANALAAAIDGQAEHAHSGSRTTRGGRKSAAERSQPVFIGWFEAASIALECGDD